MSVSQTPRLISILQPYRVPRALCHIKDGGGTHSFVVAFTVHPPMLGWILYLRPVSPLSFPIPIPIPQHRRRGSSNVLRSISRAVGAVRLLRRPWGGSLPQLSQPSFFYPCLCVQISTCENGQEAYPSHCMQLGCAEANAEGSIGGFDVCRSFVLSTADFPRGYSETSRDYRRMDCRDVPRVTCVSSGLNRRSFSSLV